MERLRAWAGSPFAALWGWPIALALLSAAGLIGALVGGPGWHWLSWLGLGVPAAASLWFGLRGRGRALAGSRDADRP